MRPEPQALVGVVRWKGRALRGPLLCHSIGVTLGSFSGPSEPLICHPYARNDNDINQQGPGRIL